MTIAAAIFLIVAAVLLFLAAIQVPSTKISLGWLGLFFWVMATIVMMSPTIRASL